ncbi:MAG: hypothetical protein ACXWFI_12720 [Methylobacter sp.]
MLKFPIVPIFVVLLGACSTTPSGPSVLVLPAADKNFDQFHNDDLQCRKLSHSQVAASEQASDSREEAQQSYDIVYTQCMYSKGHRVPVPGELMYDAREDWHLPPPPDMPAPQPGSAKSSR